MTMLRRIKELGKVLWVSELRSRAAMLEAGRRVVDFRRIKAGRAAYVDAVARAVTGYQAALTASCFDALLVDSWRTAIEKGVADLDGVDREIAEASAEVKRAMAAWNHARGREDAAATLLADASRALAGREEEQQLNEFGDLHNAQRIRL